jgi:hypothetical protein
MRKELEVTEDFFQGRKGKCKRKVIGSHGLADKLGNSKKKKKLMSDTATKLQTNTRVSTLATNKEGKSFGGFG